MAKKILKIILEIIIVLIAYLLQFYKDNYSLELDGLNLKEEFNDENNLDEEFLTLLKGELKRCIEK